MPEEDVLMLADSGDWLIHKGSFTNYSRSYTLKVGNKKVLHVLPVSEVKAPELMIKWWTGK